MVTQVTTTSINWGGVLKGAAIVTAVAVAGVVAWYAVGALANSAAVTGFFADPTLQSILTSTANGLSTAWDWLSVQATEVGSSIKSMWASLPQTLGLSTSLSSGAAAHIATATSGASAAQVASAVGATVAVGASASAGLHAINSTNLVTTHTAMLPHGMHEAAHIAAEHAHEPAPRSWSNQFASRNSTTNFADSVSRKSAPVAPAPKDTFVSQLAADTAALNRELGK